jgi:hypothetical protein
LIFTRSFGWRIVKGVLYLPLASRRAPPSQSGVSPICPEKTIVIDEGIINPMTVARKTDDGFEVTVINCRAASAIRDRQNWLVTELRSLMKCTKGSLQWRRTAPFDANFRFWRIFAGSSQNSLAPVCKHFDVVGHIEGVFSALLGGPSAQILSIHRISSDQSFATDLRRQSLYVTATLAASTSLTSKEPNTCAELGGHCSH